MQSTVHNLSRESSEVGTTIVGRELSYDSGKVRYYLDQVRRSGGLKLLVIWDLRVTKPENRNLTDRQ